MLGDTINSDSSPLRSGFRTSTFLASPAFGVAEQGNRLHHTPAMTPEEESRILSRIADLSKSVASLAKGFPRATEEAVPSAVVPNDRGRVAGDGLKA